MRAGVVRSRSSYAFARRHFREHFSPVRAWWEALLWTWRSDRKPPIHEGDDPIADLAYVESFLPGGSRHFCRECPHEEGT